MVQILETKGDILFDASKLRVALNKFIYTRPEVRDYLTNKVKSIFINGTIDFSNMTIKAFYPNRIDIITSMMCILSGLKEIILEMMKQTPDQDWSDDFRELQYIDDPRLIILLYETLIFNDAMYIKL